MSKKYKEIFKLKRMLERAEIPFDFISHFDRLAGTEGVERAQQLRDLFPDFEHYQICYPSDDNRWISVIEGLGSYGSDADLLEIMGGNKPYDLFVNKGPTVQGYLTARSVFNKIKRHYEEDKKIWKN